MLFLSPPQTTRLSTFDRTSAIGFRQKTKIGSGWTHEVQMLYRSNEGSIFQSIASLLKLALYEIIPTVADFRTKQFLLLYAK